MTKQECAYALKVLQEKKELVRAVGFATDRPEVARWQMAAIDAAVAALTRPRYEMNPFI